MKQKEILKVCQEHGETLFVLEGRNYYRCKKCRVANVKKQRHRTKQKLVDYFGGKCILCGYNRCTRALQFHHLDPNEKDFELSTRGLSRSFSILLEEAKKCVLVCANCHMELHDELRVVPESGFREQSDTLCLNSDVGSNPTNTTTHN